LDLGSPDAGGATFKLLRSQEPHSHRPAGAASSGQSTTVSASSDAVTLRTSRWRATGVMCTGARSGDPRHFCKVCVIRCTSPLPIHQASSTEDKLQVQPNDTAHPPNTCVWAGEAGAGACNTPGLSQSAQPGTKAKWGTCGLIRRHSPDCLRHRTALEFSFSIARDVDRADVLSFSLAA
jgi:hypothetical protein